MRTLKNVRTWLIIIAVIIAAVFGVKWAKNFHAHYELEHSYSTDTTNVELMRRVSDVVDIEKRRKGYKNDKIGKDIILEPLNEAEEERTEYEEWVAESEKNANEIYTSVEIPKDGIISSTCPEVTLYPSDGRDVVLGYIKSSTLYPGVNDSPSISEQIGHITYAAYELKEFNGDIKIDLSDIINNNELNKEDIVIYGSSSSQWADVFGVYELTSRWDGNEILVESPMKNKKIADSRPELKKDDETVYIFISNKEKLETVISGSDNIAKLLLSQNDINYRNEMKKINAHTLDALSIPVEQEPFGFLTSCPVTAFFLHTDVNIYLVDTGNDEVNQLVIDTLKKYYADTRAEDPHYLEIGAGEGNPKFMKYNYNIHYMSELECKAKYATLKPLSLVESFNAHDVQSNHWAFTFMNFDHLTDAELKKIAKKVQYEDQAKFDFDTETFVFPNFKTDKAAGHCGGMALEVAYCHNINGPVADYHTEGGIVLPEGTVSYKIGTERNQTLLDRYLSDYQYSGYTENGILNYGEDEDTDEFLDMMDVMLEMTNKNDIDKERYSLITHTAAVPYLKNNGNSRQLYKYSEIVDPLKKEINNDRVAIAAFSDKSISFGHVVNIYDYEDRLDESGTPFTRFYIYDSNYPGDNSLYVDMYPVSSDNGEDGLRYSYKTAAYEFTTDVTNNEYKLTLMFVNNNNMDIIRNHTPEHNEYTINDGEYVLTQANVTTETEKF